MASNTFSLREELLVDRQLKFCYDFCIILQSWVANDETGWLFYRLSKTKSKGYSWQRKIKQKINLKQSSIYDELYDLNDCLIECNKSIPYNLDECYEKFMIFYISFSVSSHPYLLFSNKRDIRIYEVQDKPSSDLRRSKPRTTPAVKV